LLSGAATGLSQIVHRDSEMEKTFRPRLWLPILVLLACVAVSAQEISSTAEVASPDLTRILQLVEDVQNQNTAQSQSYEVTREYKVFQGDEKQPSSEIMAQISFVPPSTKTYRISRADGKSRGEKMVRELLDQEVEAAKRNRESEVSRANYDFVFLRQETLGILDEYVLRIIPKRKEHHLFRGQVWVDTTTFRIRRLEGIPAESPSFWITNIHITMQFGEVERMWMPISVDAIATVRFSGRYTIAGHNISAGNPQSTISKR
jgi:outer membrane lipoprotein-sorting protein